MTIQDLIKTYPNDAELGAAVRSLFMGDCEIAFLLEDKKSYLSIEDDGLVHKIDLHKLHTYLQSDELR